MKNYIIILSLLLPSYSWAGTFPFFTDGSVRVIVQGNDTDAVSLYDSLTAEPVESNGINEKKYELKASSGELIFQVSCRKAITSAAASCTVVFNEWLFHPATSQINSEEKYANLEAVDKFYASEIASNFNETNGNVFVSEDHSLRIVVLKDHNDKVNKFIANYQDMK